MVSYSDSVSCYFADSICCRYDYFGKSISKCVNIDFGGIEMNSYSKEIRENAKAELDVAKMEAKTEKIRANASQKILEKGARKEKYNNLLRFEFSSDPAEHEHQLLQLCGDFLNCYDEKGGAKLYKAYNSLLEKKI
ncbi:MAG: hypothetical protein L6V90_12485 [Treponema succinifaciens]|nr:MAG: hypothetical protein L6V90_12485 [Treponema succinifaciens]